jgi:CheY-like chemotaxis protein
LATARNVLIVEDESEWRDIYVKTAAREGVRTVKIAAGLAEATTLIDEMQFAMAFIDIGLNVGDDRNIDGLQVMDKIRSINDETSIVVVTGRSGTDVLPITKDAIRRYNAHDILGKATTTPAEIKEALITGLETFEEKNALRAVPAHAVLKGDLESWQWEGKMLSRTGVQGGIQGLYEFLDRLVSGFLPLVPVKPDAAMVVETGTDFMHDAYWSRSIGAAVVICFASEAKVKPEIESAKSGRPLLGIYNVGATLNEVSAHGVSGAVFALSEARRDSFARA